MELGNLEETKEAMQAAKEEEARLEQGEEVGTVMQRGEVSSVQGSSLSPCMLPVTLLLR